MVDDHKIGLMQNKWNDIRDYTIVCISQSFFKKSILFIYIWIISIITNPNCNIFSVVITTHIQGIYAGRSSLKWHPVSAVVYQKSKQPHGVSCMCFQHSFTVLNNNLARAHNVTVLYNASWREEEACSSYLSRGPQYQRYGARPRRTWHCCKNTISLGGIRVQNVRAPSHHK